MKNTFKKLFDIDFEGKKFTIFVDQYHRFTFLEKIKDGTYHYPIFEDYKKLNQIYNVHNPFLLKEVKRYTWNEKILLGGLLLITIVNLYDIGKDLKEKHELETKVNEWQVELDDNKLVVSPSKTSEIQEIKTLKELYQVIDYIPITIEDIDQAILENEYMDSNFRFLAHKLASTIYDQYPDADLRVFYENLKNLKTVEYSEKEYKKAFQDHSCACYNPLENTIYYKTGCDVEKTIIHELAHSTFSFCFKKEGIIYTRSYPNCIALNETLNNKIVEMITPPNSYQNIWKVQEYLCTFIDFDFNKYNEEGPSYFLKELKTKFPTLDVAFINDSLNATNDTYDKLGIEIKIESQKDLLDELFTLCTQEKQENIYESFINFTTCFELDDELYKKYFTKYNNYLEQEQIENLIPIEDLEVYRHVKGFVWFDEKLYPFIVTTNKQEVLIIENGKRKLVPYNNAVFFDNKLQDMSNLFLEIQKEILMNPDFQCTNEFWKYFASQKEYVPIKNIYKSKLLWNGKEIINDYMNYYGIRVGLSTDNKIGFVIENLIDHQVIFQSEEGINYLSNTKEFYWYYPLTIENKDTIELTNIFNDYYLKKLYEEKKYFDNIFLEKQEFIVEPYYWLYVKTIDDGYGYSLNRFYIDCSAASKNIFINGNTYPISIDFQYDGPMYFKDVLKYYGILNEDTSNYTFTEEEIVELISKYLEEYDHSLTLYLIP